MTNERLQSRPSIPIGVIAIAFLVAMLLYVAGYFWRGRTFDTAWGCFRVFPTELEATAFEPFAKVESLISGKEVFSVRYVPPPPITSTHDRFVPEPDDIQ